MNLRQLFWGAGVLTNLGLSGLAQAGPMITVIPDYDHGSSVELQSQARVLRQLKAQNPELDCLFVEVDRSVNASLEAFLGGRASYFNSVQVWISQLERFTGYAFSNVIPAAFLTEVRSLQIRVYGVDLDLRSGAGMDVLRALRAYHMAGSGSSDAGRAFVEIGIVQRSQAMAKNARAEFANRGCRRAALIVGSSHLEESVNGVPSISLLKLLEQEGFALSAL